MLPNIFFNLNLRKTYKMNKIRWLNLQRNLTRAMTISFIYIDDLIFYSDHLVEHIRYVVCVRLCVRVFVSGGVDGCAGWGGSGGVWGPPAAGRGGCGPAHGRSMRSALPAYHLRATALFPSPRIPSMTYRVQDPDIDWSRRIPSDHLYYIVEARDSHMVSIERLFSCGMSINNYVLFI